MGHNVPCFSEGKKLLLLHSYTHLSLWMFFLVNITKYFYVLIIFAKKKFNVLSSKTFDLTIKYYINVQSSFHSQFK